MSRYLWFTVYTYLLNASMMSDFCRSNNKSVCTVTWETTPIKTGGRNCVLQKLLYPGTTTILISPWHPAVPWQGCCSNITSSYRRQSGQRHQGIFWWRQFNPRCDIDYACEKHPEYWCRMPNNSFSEGIRPK